MGSIATVTGYFKVEKLVHEFDMIALSILGV
jgi:hypothetical protein